MVLNKVPKVIVAHPGRQHSFRVATALKKQGMLFKYATTVYNKDNSLLMRLTKLFLGEEDQRRANKRKCPCVPDEDVIQFCEFGGLLLLALARIDSKHILTRAVMRYVSKRFQKKLANYVIKEGIDVVISYDCNSIYLFELLKKKAPHIIRVIDNAHPNRHYLYYSYHENWESVGDFSKTMEVCGYITDESKSLKFGKELLLADYHIVASSYSQKALEFEGLKTENIFRVPYGVDENKFLQSNRRNPKECLSVLFVGDVNQRKGIKQLLDAALKMKGQKVEFNIIGVGVEQMSSLYAPYKECVNFLGWVSFNELLNQLKSNHVFLFPTMGEGFGLVLLEAMAAGMPIITTSNCAGPDIVEEGIDGFIIPVGNSDAIVEKLKYLQINPHILDNMGMHAVEKARSFTWDKYEEGIVQSVKDMANRNKSF